jgi:hypothetical protein
VDHPTISNRLGEHRFLILTAPSGIYPVKAPVD